MKFHEISFWQLSPSDTVNYDVSSKAIHLEIAQEIALQPKYILPSYTRYEHSFIYCLETSLYLSHSGVVKRTLG